MKHRRFAVLAPLLLILVSNLVLGAAATWLTLASSVMSASTSGLSTGVTLPPVVGPDPSYRVGVFYYPWYGTPALNGDTIWPEVDRESITVATLLAEMTNLDRLTQPASYTTRQFSSYDRNSVSADAPGWFANADGGNYLRKDGDEYVLAEASGPGAIVRIWVGNPSGTIRIYLDDEVVLTADLFELLNGDVPPFVTPFGATRALGGNLYFPFPYREKMKITGTANDLYYHVGYRTYPKGTQVTTYSPDQAPTNLPTLIGPAPRGKKTTETQLVGPGVVRRLEIELPDDADRLREETVQIIVDGKRTVWSPLGDFFGTAPGRTPYDSLPLGITVQGTGYSNFPMPFSESLEIIVNEPVTMWVSHESRPLRFFAWWRGQNAVDTRPLTDQPVLNVTGQGRFVGLFLSIRNPSLSWWGEGDEKIFVDGEDFPSHFGTGTEDYFGYAYGDPELFQAPYHNQTRADGPMNRGFTANARFDILDDIPFQSAIRFDMELWHWKRAAVGFSTVAYWYATPGATHDFVELPLSERQVQPAVETYVAPGAIEGETLPATTSGGATHVQSGQDWTEFSSDKALVWSDASPGNQLNLDFQANDAGSRRLVLGVVVGKNSGRYDIYLNGTQVAQDMDLFMGAEAGGADESVEEIELEATVLEGTNTLEVVYKGVNPEAGESIFALDYIVTPTAVITPCPDFVDPVGVGVEDIKAIAGHWGQQSGDEGWDPRFDLDRNQRVDVIDIMSVVAALGSTCPAQSCIPSGDQNSINNALTDVGSAAILCQNAVFELTGPVVFTHDRQAVYTEGFPTGSSRALLRVVDASVTVAVNLEDRSGAVLSHVIVDGNRPRLGPADGGEALIQAGGAVSGQVIEWVKAYEPRFWSILHVFEGPGLSCSGVQIRNNELGPAGQPDGTWADGISLACRNSVVADNTITDATDGAIVIFGSPGSLIENNTIRAETRVLLGGIHLVAYHPFEGDYTGVRVTGNVIDAAGQHIKIGVAMGERVWGCLDPNEPDLPANPILRGGSVTNNTLMGDNMRYGFAVDGVADWAVLDNIDLSKHSGVPIHECHGQIPSPPAGFQFYSQRATGTFQPEFGEAYLEGALWAIDP